MATAQKKKSVSKPSSTRKATTKHAKKQSHTYPKMRSFHIARNVPPFTTFRFSRQTLYWVILIAFISISQLWILNLQLQIATLINQQQATVQSMNQK